MLDIQQLSSFSRTHCVAICTFLVPLNLLATLQTMVLVGLRRPRNHRLRMAGLAMLPALVMVFHVFTWLAIGVVMAPTYILLWLGLTCFCVNGWAIAHPASLSLCLRNLYFKAVGLIGVLSLPNRQV